MRDLKVTYLFQPKKAILRVIKEKKLVCLGDIAKTLGHPAVTIKKYLDQLEKENLVEKRKIGSHWIYNGIEIKKFHKERDIKDV